MTNYYLDSFDDIAGKYDESGIDSLNDIEKAIYTIWWLEAEVNNGGFHQYFTNSTGSDSAVALASLKKVGAIHAAELLERFILIAFGGKVPLDRVERNEVLEPFLESEELDEKLDAINLEFYRSEEDVEALVNSYVESSSITNRSTISR